MLQLAVFLEGMKANEYYIMYIITKSLQIVYTWGIVYFSFKFCIHDREEKTVRV